MNKRVRTRVAKKIANERKSMKVCDLQMYKKIQKKLISKDVHTSTALSDADLPQSQDALEYLKAITSPPNEK